MELYNVLFVLQVIISVLLMLAILTQQRGSGLSSTFGGNDSVYTSRRGVEKVLFYVTIVLALLFLGNGIVFLYI